MLRILAQRVQPVTRGRWEQVQLAKRALLALSVQRDPKE